MLEFGTNPSYMPVNKNLRLKYLKTKNDRTVFTWYSLQL